MTSREFLTIKLKQSILEIGKLMYDKGMANAYEGNISIREGDSIYITPSGICKGYLTESMITRIDFHGNVLEGAYPPSSEYKLHVEAYRLRSDVMSVIHDHSPYATAYAVAQKPISSKAYPEMMVSFGEIPLVEYGTPSTDEIFAHVRDVIFEHDVFLLSNHGVVSVGKDVYDAYFKIEAAESVAKTLSIAAQVGGEKALPEDKLAVLKRMHEEKLQKEIAARSSAR